MDETRIPKSVEKIVLLEATPRLLFRRKKKATNAKDERFRKSVQKAMVAMADAQRDGAAALAGKLPKSADASGPEAVVKTVKRARRRGMKLLQMK